MSRKRVFIYVQHLLGIGHLKRAATLASALCDAGCEVTFAAGGHPVPQLVPRSARLVQLPPDKVISIVRDEIGFSDPEFHKRETTLLASRNATREDFLQVLAAIAAGQVPTAALATHRGGIDDTPALIPGWSRPETGVIKALVEV